MPAQLLVGFLSILRSKDVNESDDGRILTILDTWVNPGHKKEVQGPRGALLIQSLNKNRELFNYFERITGALDRCTVRTKVLSSMPSGALSIFASYDGDGIDVGYTLSAYATLNFDISWDETPSSPPYTKKIDGILTSKNAGGNCTYPTFMQNPQYHLQIHPQRGSATLSGRSKAKVTLTLHTSRDTPVNISLVYSQGGRIDEYVACSRSIESY
ncbi:hypothetical protein C0992_010989 [Termitomyces sp. T32_za158]|nr:hypothetical protein C0992_010989 [Termitomyces sp. T32_za158]